MQVLKGPYHSCLMWLHFHHNMFCSVVSHIDKKSPSSNVTSSRHLNIGNQYFSNITNSRALPATFILFWAQHTSTHAPSQEEKYNVLYIKMPELIITMKCSHMLSEMSQPHGYLNRTHTNRQLVSNRMSSDNTCLPTNLQSKFGKYFSQHIDLAGSEAENKQFPEPELTIFHL